MNEPQVWTLIGVFAAGLFGMITLVSTLFLHVVRSGIGGLHAEINGLHTEIGGIHRRLDRLDGDVNALMKHAFGIDRD